MSHYVRDKSRYVAYRSAGVEMAVHGLAALLESSATTPGSYLRFYRVPWTWPWACPSSPKFRRSVSPFGVPPRAAEIRSHDQSAARASLTATRIAFWATRRASTALVICSSIVVVMPQSVPQIVAHVEH